MMHGDPSVHVDFHNADVDGFVRLNTQGAIDDLARFDVALVDGNRMMITDGEIQIEGFVTAPGREGVWRVRVDWKEVLRKHGDLT